jgi:enamine deaminase RidA (YjgF/YER057c/UK114 family)
MSVYEKLKELSITLPEAVPPAAAFLPFVSSGNLLFVSGHIARKDGKPWRGKLGDDVTVDEGKEAARAVAIDLLATLHAATGDLDSIARIVKLLIFVNCTPAFTEQSVVGNGASELLGQLFGDAGKHARSAIGVAQLPLGACVEVELIAEIAV